MHVLVAKYKVRVLNFKFAVRLRAAFYVQFDMSCIPYNLARAVTILDEYCEHFLSIGEPTFPTPTTYTCTNQIKICC